MSSAANATVSLGSVGEVVPDGGDGSLPSRAIGTPRNSSWGPIKEMFATANPYGKYSLGPDNLLGGPDHERRQSAAADAGLPSPGRVGHSSAHLH
jgi:hypothetical protein